MNNGIVKKAAFVVALSLVGTQVQAVSCPNWFSWDLVKSTPNALYQLGGDVVSGVMSQGSSLYSTVSEQGSSLYSSFNELDTRYKALVALGVAATGGAVYYGYKYFTQPKKDTSK